MTREDLEVLSRFESVWERVLSGKAEEPRAQSEDWELLPELEALGQSYHMLARCVSGDTRKRLLRLSEEANRLFCRLQTEYFLETGDIFRTDENAIFASYTPYNLRKLWKNAMKLAERLQNAGEGDKSHFEEAAAVMERQAETLKALIGESLR